jgi:hypothetical protein
LEFAIFVFLLYRICFGEGASKTMAIEKIADALSNRGYRHFCAESNGSCEQSQYWRGLETEQGIPTYL